MAVSLALAVGMVPSRHVQAVEPKVFTASAYANHWGRSDLRAYLNNVSKTNNTLPLDTTIDCTNSGNFPAKFSDAEFALVQPFTYMTNVLGASVYKLKDLFWLLSGYDNSCVISWGSEDISVNAQYSKSIATDKAHIVPISYWSYGSTTFFSWLLSPCDGYDYYALGAMRGYNVDHTTVENYIACAATFKINLNSEIYGPVIFASVASAKDTAGDGGSGAKKVEIAGSADFGKKTSNKLSDYGMWLKTKSSNTSFQVLSANIVGGYIQVNYSGGEVGQYVVAQLIREDSLENGTISIVGAQKISTSSNAQTNINTGDAGLTSEGATIKVWMEDGSGNLAAATTPVTFVGGIKTETSAVTNHRVFAMKEDLQCSWGDLAALDDTAYNNVIAGNGQDGTDGASSNSVHGVNPTNQKIYFGFHNGAPLEFWIAGRETAANGGAISKDGEIMTLYQAKTAGADTFNFNQTYKVAGKPAVTLQLAENQTGSAYPTDKITTKNLVDGYTLNWLHRTPGTEAWTDGMPTGLGTYEVRCYTPGTDNYERTYSNVVNFINKKPATRDLFNYIGGDKVYDGVQSQVTIEPKDGITGIGAITIKCGKINADGTETPLKDLPTDAGRYRVKFDVAEGTVYGPGSDLSVVL